MGNSKHSTKHSPKEIFTAIKEIEASFNRRADNPNLNVRVVADAEPLSTSFHIEVYKNTNDKTICTAWVPQVREIEDAGETLGMLEDIPVINRVSNGVSTVVTDLAIPTYYDSDINGKAVTVDDIAAKMWEQITPFFA